MYRKLDISVLSATIVSLSLCATVFLTLDDYGVTWDEPAYFLAGEEYAKWLRSPSVFTIDRHWRINHEHPPFAKVLGGISTYIFKEQLQLFDGIVAYRISNLFFVFLLTFFLFLFASRLYGNLVAFFVVLFLSLLPRVFFHSHLGALDYPVTAMWFVVFYCYWRGIEEQKWILAAVVALGFALLTKINALFLYVPILFWWSWIYQKEIVHIAKSICRGGWKERPLETKPVLSKILPLLIIPGVIFFVFWPWLWKDPFNRAFKYFYFHLEHFPIPTYYFGTRYLSPPWHLPLVLSVATVPILIWVLFIIGGIGRGLDKDSRPIVLMNLFFPILLVVLGPSKHDGVRLFLPAFPFLAIVAGAGLHYLLSWVKATKWSFPFGVGFFVIYSLTVNASVVKYHPYQSSYFNELIGGVNGARKSGLELHYWCSSYLAIIPWLNRHRDKVLWVPICRDPFSIYVREGRLKQNVRLGEEAKSDYLILMARFGMMDEHMWDYYERKDRLVSVRVSETEILGIYELD
ncbi:MAG: ArnT family glycosyltransferase [Nitrospinota bacterium]